MVSATFARNVLGSLFVVTTSMYLAPIAKKDGGLRRAPTREGFWGPPTADFDWCEENYPFSEGSLKFIAEPFNTISNILWIVLALLCGARLKQLKMLDVPALLGLYLTTMIGSGSFAFHATLLYEAQLLDELPMINFILLSSWLAYNRPTVAAASGWEKSAVQTAMLGFSFVPWMFLTEKESSAHAVGRIAMVISFTCCFIYLGYSTVKIVDELREVLPDRASEVERYHTAGFVACVCAIVAWVSDSVHCDFWQNLPLGLPYPQLHAMVWHNFMIFVVINTILLQLQHRQAFQVCGGKVERLRKEPRRAQVFQHVLPFNF